MAFCLISEQVQKFKQALKNGTINPEKLGMMTSAERRVFLEEFVGKGNGVQVNALFESKLLLKNQKAGYISWAKKVGGLSFEAKRDMISRIERMDKILNPAEEQAFLEDLVATRLGVGITETEAKKIFDLSQKVTDKRVKWETKWADRDWAKDTSWRNDSDRLEWGTAQIEIGNFVNNLKEIATREGLKTYLNPAKAIVEIGGIAKTTKATLDLSALFRQGWKTIWTNPLIWQKNARNSFANFVSTLKNKEKVMDAINADIVSRPYYDLMVKARLAIHTVEEAFPTRLPQKIPLFGRMVRASDTAFTGFAYRQRADIFEANLKVAQKVGVNIKDVNQLKPIASMINGLTGRGGLGGLEPSANIVNNIFFAPRFVKSQIDLFVHPFTGAGGSGFVRKQAAKNLIRVVMGTSGVLMLAKAIAPDSVDLDPRSSNFGQIRVGNTRFDVTGGHRTLMTLASRIITRKTKSATTGIINDLNTGTYFSKTGVDVAFDFAQNKLSPMASIMRDLLKGEDFDGKKPTVAGTANNLLTPLPITNYLELKDDPNAAPILLGVLAETVGIGTNTYGKSKTNWEKSTGKELTQFKEVVGSDKFKEANDTFNKKYDEWFQGIVKTPKYQNLSDDDKRTLLSNAKEDIKEKIFKQYHFKYKETKTPSSQKRLIKSLEPK